MAKLSAAEKQRRYRECRDADPQRRQEYLQKRKESYVRDIERGKRKRISELTERNKRVQRKEWRVRQQRCRARSRTGIDGQNSAEALTPPSTPNTPPRDRPGQLQHSRRVRRREAQRKGREIEKLKLEISSWKRKYERIKKRCSRQKNASLDSPELHTQNILCGQRFRPTVIGPHHCGQWCVVQYDNTPYPGIILQVEEGSVQVKCMRAKGINLFYWPSLREDVNWYEDDQIMCFIPEPLALNRRSVQIEKKKVGIHQGAARVGLLT
ncbi:hypothetical protein AMEX_G19077 [Astyanax mexicanus]|uniref:Uncharacterized protein n=1 Tax=Astyanax mexicanus TaxID=7994 RepID=A0A8T2L5F0_ASTMX|nr:hypothetical protein AMEX_G19077 [Astyanax mexicanus]